MLFTRFPAALAAVGFSDAEIAHAMREGGPLDDIRHRTWCDNCNRTVESTLRELLSQNGLCKCGGKFHSGITNRDLVADIAGRLVPNHHPQI